MIPDPTSEIRAIRNRLSADCDYDVDRIVDGVLRHQAESGRSYLNLRTPRPTPSHTINSMHPTEMGGRDSA